MARAELLEDVAFRAECVSHAKRIVEQWRGGREVGCTQLRTSEQFAEACSAKASIERMSCTE
jgi:hypothetical protein